MDLSPMNVFCLQKQDQSSGIHSVSKKSITKIICSLVDKLQDLFMICHQALSASFGRLLSGTEISAMEIHPMPFSQLLIQCLDKLVIFTLLEIKLPLLWVL